jgi:plasmid stabilization system protein ParE
MRRIQFAPSFDQELEDIGLLIEERFGETARDEFVDDLRDTCLAIAESPGIGLGDHGYATSLLGFVFRINWVYFEYDEVEVRFLHIIDARRDKGEVAFGEQ